MSCHEGNAAASQYIYSLVSSSVDKCHPVHRLCIELILLFCPRYYSGKGVLLEVCNQASLGSHCCMKIQASQGCCQGRHLHILTHLRYHMQSSVFDHLRSWNPGGSGL